MQKRVNGRSGNIPAAQGFDKTDDSLEAGRVDQQRLAAITQFIPHGVGAQSSEVDLTSNVNRPLKHREIEHDRFNLKLRFQRSVHFMVGELIRRCQTALREAKGQTVTADEIALTAMREKNLDMGKGALRQDITRRFMWTLTRMLGRGAVTKQGWGADARWALPA